MTPDERAALDRQRRIARTPALAVERHEPLEGQESFLEIHDETHDECRITPDQDRGHVRTAAQEGGGN